LESSNENWKVLEDKAVNALVLARSSAEKVGAVVEFLASKDMISTSAATALLLEVEDARRDVTQVVRNLLDEARDMREFKKHAVETSASSFYFALDEAERGKIFLQARKNGFHSAVEFINNSQLQIANNDVSEISLVSEGE